MNNFNDLLFRRFSWCGHLFHEKRNTIIYDKYNYTNIYLLSLLIITSNSALFLVIVEWLLKISRWWLEYFKSYWTLYTGSCILTKIKTTSLRPQFLCQCWLGKWVPAHFAHSFSLFWDSTSMDGLFGLWFWPPTVVEAATSLLSLP